MLYVTRKTLVSRLSAGDSACEIGIGNRVGVARELAAAGVAVTATDIHECDVPSAVEFVQDDITSPRRSIYADADLLYALNLPPELHRPTLRLAREVDATFQFTTLGGEQPVVPVEREQLPGETLFRARQSRSV